MQFIKSKKGLAALLLIGICVLGVTLIVNAIDIDVTFEATGFPDDHPHSEWEEINEDDLTASCYIYGSLWVEDDENGDYVIGGIHAQGAGWVNQDNSVTLFSYAYSSLYDGDVAGKANAWIKFPHEPLISHPDGPGAVDVGAGADKMGVTIYDSRTYQPGDQLGQLKGGASLKANGMGIPRISVKYTARVIP